MQQQQISLQQASKDVITASCQLLGPERFLQQALHSVQNPAHPAAAAAETSQVEVYM